MIKFLKNIGLLRLRPANPRGNYSDSHLSKGQDYHERFNKLTGRALMMELESQFLINVVENNKIENYLDFASGTGRVLDILVDYPKKCFAIDISDSMLSISKKRHFSKVNYLCEDFRHIEDKLQGRKFDLITAFRFFPNAEYELRVSAIRFLASLLTSNGMIILNNHRNFWSIPYVCYRLIGVKIGQSGMTHRNITTLANLASLKIVSHSSYGIIPQTEEWSLLSWPLTKKIERMLLASSVSNYHLLGYNSIYVLKKDNIHQNYDRSY